MEVQLKGFTKTIDELGENKDHTGSPSGHTNTAYEGQHVDEDHQSALPTFNTEMEKESDLETNLKLIKRHAKKVFIVLITLAYFAYFGYAMYVRFGDEPSIRLLVCTVFGIVYASGRFLMKNETFNKMWKNFIHGVAEIYSQGKRPTIVRWTLYVVAAVGCTIYIIINVAVKEPGKLRALLGMVVFVLGMVIVSTNKRKIRWHTVFWGFVAQFLLGIFVLKSDAGKNALTWMSDRLKEFMEYSIAGSIFLFGERFAEHPFAFIALPQVVTFCAFIQLLIYLGVIPFIVRTLGRAVAFLLDVSAPEAINGVASMFLGGGESTMVVQKYLKDISVSQLFTMMTSDGASVAGSAIIQFMLFGVSADYLFAASFMSVPAAIVCAKIMVPDNVSADYLFAAFFMSVPAAIVCAKIMIPDDVRNDVMDVSADYLFAASFMSVPAAIVCAKIMVPDDVRNDVMDVGLQDNDNNSPDQKYEKKSQTDNDKSPMGFMPEPKGIVEAIVSGAYLGVSLIGAVAGMLVVFYAVVEMLDATVEWFGDRVDVHITATMLLGWIFFPAAYVMGVDPSDCEKGGQLIGIKLLANPVLGYQRLGDLVRNRAVFEQYSTAYNDTLWRYDGDDIILEQWNQTLSKGIVSVKSETVLTYALCGVSSLTSLGVVLGTFKALAPGRMQEVSRLALPAMAAGTIASFLTACVAGLIG